MKVTATSLLLALSQGLVVDANLSAAASNGLFSGNTGQGEEKKKYIYMTWTGKSNYLFCAYILKYFYNLAMLLDSQEQLTISALSTSGLYYLRHQKPV